MRVILLSGGSGKRLWPLSNDIRSKQFLKLFQNEDGIYESMLQRVYRQISRTLGAQITVATSLSQIGAIKNQLTDRVTISAEPCRRDTFPAIALSIAYLKYELGADDDECVVVCPVDPYVDDSYYRTIGELERKVNEIRDGIVLMGIAPTCPSEKYGYIIPQSKENGSRVDCFKEKPNEETAKEYLKKGALWNAGVFAFRLGYILARVREIISFENYKDLFVRYANAPKISFDYAVLEKEKNVFVVGYKGEWKDVGTWNAMCETLPYEKKGNVISDEECSNVKIINETDLPVICMGGKNLVIAVGADGILVADKERSDKIKPYAEMITEESRIAEEEWGEYHILEMTDKVKVVRASIGIGKEATFKQSGKITLTVLSGEILLKKNGETERLEIGDTIAFYAADCELKAITDAVLLETILY